jgi:hypothetical protein
MASEGSRKAFLPPELADCEICGSIGIYEEKADVTMMQRALANLNAILASAPVYRLRCHPERAVIPLVRSIL